MYDKVTVNTYIPLVYQQYNRYSYEITQAAFLCVRTGPRPLLRMA